MICDEEVMYKQEWDIYIEIRGLVPLYHESFSKFLVLFRLFHSILFTSWFTEPRLENTRVLSNPQPIYNYFRCLLLDTP
jgi:hypothetical protein